MIAKLFSILLLFWLVDSSCGTHIWENRIAEYNNPNPKPIEKQTSRTTFCKDCGNNNMADDSSANDEDLFASEVSKRMRNDDSTENAFVRHRLYTFHHQPNKFCSCNHEKRLIDLGSDYFPRYVSDMICVPGGCGPNYECRPKRFKVWAMRRRQEDDEPGSEPVPKELRDFWTGESIVTTIDCECIP